MAEEPLRIAVVRLLSDVYSKLIDLETRLSELENKSSLLPLGYSRLAISELLISHFDTSELDGIGFNLGFDSDHLPGRTREERTRALIAFCERRQIVGKLLEECERQRPKIVWPQVPSVD